MQNESTLLNVVVGNEFILLPKNAQMMIVVTPMINIGVNHLPSISTTFVLCHTDIDNRKQNTALNHGNSMELNRALKPAKEMMMQRGTAIIGPINANISIISGNDTYFPNLPKNFITFPSYIIMEIMPNNGRIMPVTVIPNIDQGYVDKLIDPMYNGYIKFPAPKNIEKMAKPVIKYSKYLC